MMRQKALIIILVIFVLCFCACEDDDEVSVDVAGKPFALESTIPSDGATGIDIHSALVFHFNHPIDSAIASQDWAVLYSMDSEESSTRVDCEIILTGSNIILNPVKPLLANSRYMASASAYVRDLDGAFPAQAEPQMSMIFKTGGGPPKGDIQPAIAAIRPSDSDEVFDWATFHLNLSEPIDSLKTSYGDQISLRREGTNSPVPSQMFIKGSRIVIDPDSDLIPGELYELVVADTLRDAYWDSVENGIIYQFQVLGSTPREKLVMDLCPTRGDLSECDPASTNAAIPDSMYTGERANSIIMESNLFGRVEFNLSGFLEMEIGNIKLDSSKIPVVMRKGQRIFADPVESVDQNSLSAALAVDQISLILLSDAHGFIEDARFGGGMAGSITFDIELNLGMNSNDSTLNALVGACVLGIQLSGRATVDNAGRFALEIAGFSSIQMLSDTAKLTVSISAISTDESQIRLLDNVSPWIVSSYPKNYESHFPLGDRLSLIFSEPIDPTGIHERVALFDTNNIQINGHAKLEASVLQFVPSAPLQPNTEHRFLLSENLSDLLSNRIGEGHSVYFKTGPTEATSVPPLIATIDPPADSTYVRPGNLPVTIHFTQLMEKGSFILGDNIRIKDIETDQDVPGVLATSWYDVTFWPNEGFEVGRVYRLMISDEISNYIGIRLDIDGDGEAPPEGAFSTMEVIEFSVSRHDDRIFPIVFRVDPATDVDGSGQIDSGETPYESNLMTFSPQLMFPSSSHFAGQLIAYFGPIQGVDSALRSIIIPDGIHVFGTSIPTPRIPFIGRPETGRISVEIMEEATATMGAERTEGASTSIVLNSVFSVQDEDLNEMFSHEYIIEGDIAFDFDEFGRMNCTFDGKGGLSYSYPIIEFDVPLSVETSLRASSIIQ